MTIALIAANVLVFVHEITLGARLDEFVMTWGFVPARFFAGLDAGAPVFSVLVPLATSMFLHGGWVHLLGNVWFLWIFGDNVEDRLGHAGFVLFYAGCGLLAGLAHAAAQPDALLPAVGASGAIAGVLGAYFVFHPGGRVLALLPLFLFFTTVEVPAWFFLIAWFVLQTLSGAIEWSTTEAGATGGTAWWAHVGGFVAGVGIAFIVSRLRPARRAGRSSRQAFPPR